MMLDISPCAYWPLAYLLWRKVHLDPFLFLYLVILLLSFESLYVNIFLSRSF